MRRPNPRPPGFPTRVQGIIDHWGSVQALARATGIATRTLEDWVRGHRQPHGATIQKFCRGAEVDQGWLLTGKEGGTEVTWRPGSQASGQVVPESLDGIESLSAVSRQWLYHIGVTGQILLFHSTKSIGDEIAAYEPVLFRRVAEELRIESADGIGYTNTPYRHVSGEIVLVEDPSGLYIYQIPTTGLLPYGVRVIGSAFWTGRRINLHVPRPLKNG